MWNKHGQAIFLSFMLAVTFFFIGLMIAPVISSSADIGRSAMDCTNSSIATSQKVSCTLIDLVTPYTVATIFALAGLLVGALVK